MLIQQQVTNICGCSPPLSYHAPGRDDFKHRNIKSVDLEIGKVDE
jgi:hypothetical protein